MSDRVTNQILLRLAFCGFAFLAFSGGELCGAVVDFEDLTAFTSTSGNTDGQPGGRYYNGDSGVGTNSNGWSSGGVAFSNSYNSSFGGFWSGWAYSNVVNSVTAGFGNQYASAAGGGAMVGGGVVPGGNYALAYWDGSPNFINLPAGSQLVSVDVTNTTYAWLSMRDGDAFGKRFGGVSGNDADFLRVELAGFDGLGGTGTRVGAVTVDLADFTDSDNSMDFILSDWLTVDLSSLANARSLSLSFSSSDVSSDGFINTPTYVAIDNLTFSAVPEPAAGTFLVIMGGLMLRGRRRLSVS